MAGGQAAASPETVVRDFYVRRVGGDAAGSAALWSAQQREIERETETLAHARCTRLLSLRIDEVTIRGDRAAVHADVALASTSAMPDAKETIVSDSARFTLRRQEGRWRIVDRRLDSADRAERLERADAAGRAALLADPLFLEFDVVDRLCTMAVANANREDFRGAETLWSIADSIAHMTGDDRSLAVALSIRSILLRRGSTRDPAASIAAARESVAHAEAAGDPDVLAKACLRLGRAIQMRDGYVAQTSFDRVVAVGDQLLEPATAAYAAGESARAADNAGDHAKAFRCSRLALHYARLSGQEMAIMAAEQNVGGAYVTQGDCQAGVPYYRRALTMARKLRFYPIIVNAATVVALCTKNKSAGRDLRAIVDETLRELGPNADADMKAQLLSIRASVKTTRGDLRGADADVTAMLRYAEESKHTVAIVDALERLAALRLTQHRPNDVLAALARLWVIHPAFRTTYFDDKLMEAGAHLQLHDYAHAVDDLRGAVAMAETDRSRVVGTESDRQRTLEARIVAYTRLAKVLVESGDAAGALFIADWSKARGLLDRLPQNIRNDHLGTAAFTRREELLPLVRGDVAAVEFCIGDEAVLAFTIRRGRGNVVRIRGHRLPISRDALDREVSSYLRRLSHRELTYAAESRRLYRQLLEPLASDLAGVRVLAIIPDGALWRTPIESLIDPSGHFVTERFACFYVPSLASYKLMLAETRETKSSRGFLAFANATIGDEVRGREAMRGITPAIPLPDAEREVRAAARNFASNTIYVGTAALESRLKRECAAYRVIHFATHGVFDDDDPMHSYLVLTGGDDDDGMLETREMASLHLNADLVVLSACETARGTFHRGEGVIGMTWALFNAGCPSVIATQWSVASRETADLMIGFYADWHRHGDTPFAKARALRSAQLRLLENRATRHPFYWAPFIVLGVP